MPKYRYSAKSEGSKIVQGFVVAADISAAELAIISKGLIPEGIVEDNSQGSILKSDIAIFSRVKPADLILFTKQLKTMIHAGIPILRCLDILKNQTESSLLKKSLEIIHSEIKNGKSLHDAFSSHPKIFSNLYCSMLKVGEYSGKITEVLDRLIYIIEHEYKVKKDISSALTYPVIVLSMLSMSFVFLLTTVVPKFVNIFKSSRIELPVPTQICMALYNAVSLYWMQIIVALIAIVFTMLCYIKTKNGRIRYDSLLLKMPFVGIVLQKAAMSRFASIFAILQSSGMSILETIDVVSGTIGNAAIANEFDGLRVKVKDGHGLAAPLSESSYFPPMVINMIVIGEESGNLDAMLKDVSEHYDYEVSHSIARMSEMLGPFLMLCMAVIVGFFGLAIFMPMWDLTKMVQH